jgi:hypothetical protein
MEETILASKDMKANGNGRLVHKMSLVIVGVNVSFRNDRLWISDDPEWMCPFSAGVATFRSLLMAQKCVKFEPQAHISL